ncbi:MAG: transcription-repair coupling factor [Chloroflexota bacterium]
MNLSGLLVFVEELPEFRRLADALRGQRGQHQAVVLDAALPAFLAALYRVLGLPTLVLSPSPERARRLAEQLQSWLPPDRDVHLLPEPDVLPFERLSGDQATEWERLKLLSRVVRETSPLVVASAAACAARTIARADFSAAVLTLKPGTRLNLEQVLRQWQALGYEPAEVVEVPGTFSRRGGILDIYPPSSDSPLRIELFGDGVESLRTFDPGTQRSGERVAEATITPAREMLMPPLTVYQGDVLSLSQDSNLTAEARQRLEQDLSRIQEGQWFPGAEFYAPLLNTGCVLDYLPRPCLVAWDNHPAVAATVEALERQGKELRQERVNGGELPPDFPSPYFPGAELKRRIEDAGIGLRLSPWETEGGEGLTLPFVPAMSYGGKLDLLLDEALRVRMEGRRLVLASQQAARLSELLAEKDILTAPQSMLEQLPAQGAIAVVQGPLAQGWWLKGVLAVLSDGEIFGSAKEQRLPRKRPVRRQLLRSEMTPGDYVVHVDHGVALFSGVTTMRRNGTEREYLVLEYAEGDKVYVPVEHLDRVSRYVGATGTAPSLSRLGTQEWARVKQRAQRSVADMAVELLSLYASRELAPGFAFSPDASWQAELEASFPYVETSDQLEAVERVKREMEKGRPMDRLVCGDVGYGKTEVALRATFKAVLGGKQVAVLVPTTVLAQQHYETFSERLRAFPVNAEMLSRFRSEKEQQAILKGLASGKVDICIGTHRLLQKDVVFRDLGLVVIDEEQRFGVMHKEKLKQMRREVDVLTLSATPIPRTLHMALAGVRDMSLIETPPEERLPVKTFVGEWEARTVREAILRELKRDGQVLLVHNRVQSIRSLAAELQVLVPEARMSVAHGQMPEEELERVMAEFVAGKSDVLVCTTIVESGLDMPRANTLVVKDAHRLGLTQLYQLRGRVGRSSLRAYAYFLYPRGKTLTQQARERLSTIAQAGELGAGFHIAMKDLEIRGAGNLLGVEQSGHIAAVGFDLYCRLLEQAVAELREKETGVTKKRPVLYGPSIDLPLSGYLPAEYVPDLSTRLALYHRLADAEEEGEIASIGAELRDRFGPLPQQAEHLLYVAKVRLLAMEAGVESLATEDREIVVRLLPGKELRLQYLGAVYGNRITVKSNQVRLDLRRLGDGWRGLLPELLVKLGKD